MRRIIATLAIVASLLAFVEAQICKECQTSNDVYCHNQTSYQNCMKNAAFGDIVNCPTGTVCSNSVDVCVDKSLVDGSTVVDVCGTSASCQACLSNNKYACVSQTQFARCSSSGVILSSSVFSCDEGEICILAGLANFNNICVPSCAADFVGLTSTCSNSEYEPSSTTSTSSPATTPSTSVQADGCTAAANADSSLSSATYFFTSYTADATCRSYLYCQRATTGWTTVFLSCSGTKPYFDPTTSNCVATKPNGCT
ncbi:uncharacterized protein LOC110190770 [Drosophila serrata]|uniref:uncharacterized protein LOC110190770 n=1 Tax=Drosophila serrata TaxID=7274 RepID=UPI000A1CFCA7|nr:uncharacterized protein LOC110190770 [Drosophila serrata]